MDTSIEPSETEPLDKTLAAIALHITPAQANLLDLLWCNSVVPQEALIPLGASRVTMHRLRERLRPYDVLIENRVGLGFVLTPESRDLIRARLSNYALRKGARKS